MVSTVGILKIQQYYRNELSKFFDNDTVGIIVDMLCQFSNRGCYDWEWKQNWQGTGPVSELI